MIVMCSYGNSDDKLPQRHWALFQIEFKDLLSDAEVTLFGDWHSYPDSSFQNAAYCFEIDDDQVPEVQGQIRALATQFNQDSIAWNQMTETLFLGREVHTLNHPGSDRWTGGDRKDER